MNAPTSATQGSSRPAGDSEAKRLRDLSPQQWKSGIAAWLGWLFDGLDMHIYTLVATAFVAILLNAPSYRSDFKRLDSNSDSALVASEWVSTESFQKVDRNSNGRIELQE